MDKGKDISFDDFLNILQMDEQTYILALRSRLQKPTIFLKQNPKIYEQMHMEDLLVNFVKQILICTNHIGFICWSKLLYILFNQSR
jgi:hypothetical protein